MPPPDRSPESERRPVTVLFADLAGFTRLVEASSDEAAFELVTGCLRVLDAVARRHGGSVDKYLGDCVMAVFGAPQALELPARSAVNAAIEMLEAVAGYSRERSVAPPLEVHIGIESGFVISGDVSGPVLREFAVMGDAVNVASRLKDEARPGQVFVGPNVWRALHDTFELRDLGARAVKGKQKDVHVYELLSRRPRLHREARGLATQTELVGREEALAGLGERLDALAAGEGAVACVVGEAGIGKSRLKEELRARAETAGARWLEGRCLPNGRTLALHPFADLLRAWVELPDGESGADSRARLHEHVTRALGPGAEGSEALLASVMGLPLSRDEEVRLHDMGADAREHATVHALRALLVALSREHPLVVALEDLHWADRSSLGLATTLFGLSRDHPVLFLGLLRPGYEETSDPLLQRLEDSDWRTTRVELTPLSHGDSRRVLRNLLRATDVPPELLERIARQAAGNPFFLEEVIRGLLDDGALVVEDGGLRATERLAAVRIPVSIHDVLLARIDRLTPEARHLLQVCAVVGPQAHRSVVAAVLGEGHDLDAALAELSRVRLVQAADPSGRRLAFHHPLVQEVAYANLLQRRREALHRAVADAIEAHLSDTVAGYHAMLAYHCSLGCDRERAERYLFLAGDEASRLAAADEALAFFQQAAALYLELHGEGGDPEKKAALEAKIAAAHANRGEYVSATQHFDAALRLLGERVPASTAQMLRSGVRCVPTLLRVLRRREKRRRPAPSEHERRVLALMFDRSRAETTTAPTRFLVDSLETFRRLDRVDPAAVAGAAGLYAAGSGIFSFGGVSFRLSARFLERARPLVREDDAASLFLFRMMSFMHHFLAGSWGEAREIEASLLDQALARGVLWDVTNYLALVGEKQLLEGRFDEAAATVQQLEKIADAYQFDLARSSRNGVLTWLLVERRLLPEGLAAAEVHYAHHGEPMLNLHALGNEARALTLLGRMHEAETALAAAETLLGRAGVVPPFYRSSYLRGRASFDVARLAAAERPTRMLRRRAMQSTRDAVRVTARVAGRQPECLRLDAQRLARVGRTGAARAAYERGLARARQLGTRPELGRMHAELGRLLERAGGSDAHAHLDEARTLLASLGLEWDLAQYGL